MDPLRGSCTCLCRNNKKRWRSHWRSLHRTGACALTDHPRWTLQPSKRWHHPAQTAEGQSVGLVLPGRTWAGKRIGHPGLHPKPGLLLNLDLLFERPADTWWNKWCVVLYGIALYCIAMYCALFNLHLFFAVFHCSVVYCNLLYPTDWVALFCLLCSDYTLHSIVQYLLYCPVLHCNVLHCGGGLARLCRDAHCLICTCKVLFLNTSPPGLPSWISWLQQPLEGTYSALSPPPMEHGSSPIL